MAWVIEYTSTTAKKSYWAGGLGWSRGKRPAVHFSRKRDASLVMQDFWNIKHLCKEVQVNARIRPH